MVEHLQPASSCPVVSPDWSLAGMVLTLWALSIFVLCCDICVVCCHSRNRLAPSSCRALRLMAYLLPLHHPKLVHVLGIPNDFVSTC